MHAYLASTYFNACSKCPGGHTLFSCFTQSVIVYWRSRGGKNRHATLETVSEIPDHLMKAFIFFGLHPSMLISFKCWNKWVCLVLIVNCSWAELDTGPKGMAQKHKGLPTERTQNGPSELQLPGKESQGMILPHFSGSCVWWFLYITKIHAFSPSNLTSFTTHTRVYN